MVSRLIIGCRHCFTKVSDFLGYTLSPQGIWRLPFPIFTAYTKKDLYGLFVENYTCPFCDNSLALSPRMMEFILNYLEKYDIAFDKEFIVVLKGDERIVIERNPEDPSKPFYPSGNNLNLQEIEEIYSVSNEFNASDWFFGIETDGKRSVLLQFQVNLERNEKD